MSRSSRSDRLNKGARPKRRAAAKSHFFKYQLANNPTRAEEIDLKRALEESLRSQQHSRVASSSNGKRASNNNNTSVNASNVVIISSTNSSDLSGSHPNSNSSGGSNESLGIITRSTPAKRTRSSTPLTNNNHTLLIVPVNNKRARSSISPNSSTSSRSNISTRNSTNLANSSINHINLSSSSVSINNHTNAKAQSQGELKRNRCDTNNRSLKQLGSVTRSPFSTPSPLPSLSAQHTNTSPHVNNKAIRTYSRDRSIQNLNGSKQSVTPKTLNSTNGLSQECMSNSSQVSKSTQTSPDVDDQDYSSTQTSANKATDDQQQKQPTTSSEITTITIEDAPNHVRTPPPATPSHYLKFKRESKNYAYVKMTALKVSTSKMPSNSAKTHSKKSPSGNLSNGNNVSPKVSPKNNSADRLSSMLNNASYCNEARDNNESLRSNQESNLNTSKRSSNSPNNDVASVKASKSNKNAPNVKKTVVNTCSSFRSKADLGADDQGLDGSLATNVKVAKKRLPPGSWSLLGVPEEKVIFLRDDEPARRMICYPAIKHIEGDVIQVRDSVLLRSGARKTDLPYIAKVCAFWEDAETGGIMMSLYWYYRPEHTEEGRKSHQLLDEIFASRHRDVDSVECIEDKCYVLTFNEYCRYRKRCKMEQVSTTWSLADVTIPVSNESYPRRNRIPDSDINPELVFCCRQMYDSRTRRLIKNPHINAKYGHI